MRSLNLRQVEAFKAVIEAGTVSAAAEILNISQPAVSKQLANLEMDTGLGLFERVRGRLVPTSRGMRLYEEIERIFTGLRQVERAVETIRREEQGELIIGVIHAISGPFISKIADAFLREHPSIHLNVRESTSLITLDRLATRQIDLALVSARVDNPYLRTVPFLERSLVCIMPKGHGLEELASVAPHDLTGQRIVSFPQESYTRRRIDAAFTAFGVHLNSDIEVSTAPTLCEVVASGHGISLVHPLFAMGMADRLSVRPFAPDIRMDFLMCQRRDPRNEKLVNAFADRVLAAAQSVLD